MSWRQKGPREDRKPFQGSWVFMDGYPGCNLFEVLALGQTFGLDQICKWLVFFMPGCQIY